MKTHYTAEIDGHPSARLDADYNVARGETTTPLDLARRVAISAAMCLVEPEASCWEAGAKHDEYIAHTPTGDQLHTITAALNGPAWGDSWSGTVTVNGHPYIVYVS